MNHSLVQLDDIMLSVLTVTFTPLLSGPPLSLPGPFPEPKKCKAAKKLSPGPHYFIADVRTALPAPKVVVKEVAMSKFSSFHHHAFAFLCHACLRFDFKVAHYQATQAGHVFAIMVRGMPKGIRDLQATAKRATRWSLA